MPVYCLPVYLSPCLSVCFVACLLVCLTSSLSIFLYFCLPICLTLSACLPISVFLSATLYACLSISLSACLSHSSSLYITLCPPSLSIHLDPSHCLKLSPTFACPEGNVWAVGKHLHPGAGTHAGTTQDPRWVLTSKKNHQPWYQPVPQELTKSGLPLRSSILECLFYIDWLICRLN